MSSCCAQPSSLKATRHSGGVGAGIVTALVERRFAGQIARVSGVDTYVPLGDAPTTVLVSEDDIERGIRRLLW
jgi:2-oxoisovalerate dehydrogenase E1 component